MGPNTVEVIQRILTSRKFELQTYRMCQGVLSFTRKYARQVLEETCKQALEYGKVTYTFVKNRIPVVAEDLRTSGGRTVTSNAYRKKPPEYAHGRTDRNEPEQHGCGAGRNVPLSELPGTRSAVRHYEAHRA